MFYNLVCWAIKIYIYKKEMDYLKEHFPGHKNCKYVYSWENNNVAILRKNGKMAMACKMLCIEKKIRAVAMTHSRKVFYCKMVNP